MTRIIAGTAKGQRLAVPGGSGTRPTSDRAREALFSTLVAHRGSLDGAAVLDLYAGSGAVGLEALSRGARTALFVEADGKALRVLRANVATLGLSGAQVAAGRVSAVLSAGRPDGAPYDLAFLDPPYAEPAERVREVVALLADGGWLAPGAFVVVERSSREQPWEWPAGLAPVQERRYGEATLWYGRAAGASESPVG